MQARQALAAYEGGGVVPHHRQVLIGSVSNSLSFLVHIIPWVDCAVTSEYQLLDCIRANLCPWKCMEAAASWLHFLASLVDSLVVLGQGAGAPSITGSVEEG